jgi:ubiquinone/menaquinone biosynthesis C-methylase UbiE
MRAMERARAFGAFADSYERGRPGYPAEAIAWLLGDEPLDVLDLGAGTGKLSRALAAADHRVTAVEPDTGMLAVLRRTSPQVAALEGSAEDIPLPAASVDAVTSGQAFHWFDPERALPEIARVLRPAGVLGLLWNMRDENVPWQAALNEALRAERREIYSHERMIATLGGFGEAEYATFPYSQPIDRATLLEAIQSRSYVILLPERERADLLEAAGAVWDAHPGVTAMVYVTEAYRITPRGGAA